MEGVAMRNRTFARCLWQYFFFADSIILLHYIQDRQLSMFTFDLFAKFAIFFFKDLVNPRTTSGNANQKLSLWHEFWAKHVDSTS